MIRTSDDLESLLNRLERRFERLAGDTYIVVLGRARTNVALKLAPPLLVVQAGVGQAPSELSQAAPLYKKLLELNAGALAHAAYGLEGDSIVLAAALALENLDANELEAVLADIDVALGEHVPLLRSLASSVS